MSDEKNPTAAPTPPWLEATPEDVAACNIDAEVPAEATADWHSLSDLFYAADRHKGIALASHRTFRMLGGLLSMMLQPESASEPFRPMVVWGDGRRSASLDDFRSVVEAVVAITARSQHPAIRARAADVVWTLERKRHDMGLLAMASYCQVLDDIAAGVRKFAHEEEQEGGRLGVGLLRRCVVIAKARSFGAQAPDLTPLIERIEAIRRRALESGDTGRHLSLARLELDYGLADPAALATDIEASVAKVDPAKDGHHIVDALKVAVRARRRAQDNDGAVAQQHRISETYLAMADHMAHSAMIASSHVADAISTLAGIPDTREKRRALRHRLIDVQAGITDEMESFFQPLDIEDLRAMTAERVKGLSFYDALFHFAVMRFSPDPAQERENALEAMRKHPLSAMFAASFHDHEGKVRHVATGGGPFGDTGDKTNLDVQIAQHQSISRRIDVGLFDVVRRYICSSYYISTEALLPVLSASPFVPKGQDDTFAHGLAAFLRGEFPTAIYVLTPLVEAGVRWCLKAKGFEVTTFDDASQTQQDKTLSALYRDQLADIEEVFGTELAFNIEQVFLKPAGPQLRHAVAHGLLFDGGPYSADAIYACWLVLHLCIMPLYDHRHKLGLGPLADTPDLPAQAEETEGCG